MSLWLSSGTGESEEEEDSCWSSSTIAWNTLVTVSLVVLLWADTRPPPTSFTVGTVGLVKAWTEHAISIPIVRAIEALEEKVMVGDAWFEFATVDSSRIGKWTKRYAARREGVRSEAGTVESLHPERYSVQKSSFFLIQ